MLVKEVRSKALVIPESYEERKKLINMLTLSYQDTITKRERIIRLYEERDGLLIPRGLVKKQVEERDWERVKIPFSLSLYPYQEKAVKGFIETGGNGIIVAPMGSGKTIMALYLASYFGLKTLVVVHTEALFLQWIKMIKEVCGFEPSIIRGDICDTSAPITVGMLKTLAIGKRIDRKKLYTTFGFTIYDEVHRCPTDKFHIVVGMFWDKYRLGLSGTPERKDKLEKIIYYHLSENVIQVEKEVLKPKVFVFNYIDPHTSSEGCYKNGEFFLPWYLNKISLISERNYLIAYLTYISFKKGRKVIILSDRLRILKEVEKILRKIGIKDIGWITGERKKDGKIYLATFGSASEGIDIPELDCLILATPRTTIKQAIGRIIRPKKIQPVVFDIVDTSQVMKKFYKARRKFYLSSGMEVKEYTISRNEIIRRMEEW